jgi:hypothetical protein
MSEQPAHPASDLSRRDLFRKVGFATGGALLLGLPNVLSGWSGEAHAALRPDMGTGPIALELEGQFSGMLTTVDGGGFFADIVPEGGPGPDMIQRKRPGPVRFEDIVLGVTLGAIDKSLSTWIADTLTKNPVLKNGAIVYADVNGNQVKRLEFTGALLTEVLVSDCDAAEGKQPAALTLRLIPQSTRLTGGAGKLSSPIGTKSKQVSSGHFRFNVQGLEQSCARITKVEGIGARRAVSGAPVGQDKFRSKQAPGMLDCALVRIVLPEVDAGPFYTWFDEMVIKGNPLAERGGLLEWFDPTMKTVVASVQLGGLGIVRYEPDPVASGGERKLGQVQVDMYCETINLTL